MTGSNFVPTVVYDDYWRFAAERQAVYLRRLTDHKGPWTDDPVIAAYRFTNPFRAADRVSQYLIREVQYGRGRSQEPVEVFFRTMLFKVFNKIETWELLERALGRLTWWNDRQSSIVRALDAAMARGVRIYSAAYIKPAAPYGHAKKHANDLALIADMIATGAVERLQAAAGLREAYEIILSYSGLGKFLAFQYAIDLNYSSMLRFDEGEFVVAGPGALDGIAKCFSDIGGATAADVCHHMADIQEQEFARLGLSFDGLFGRRLQPIDCQNLFCEISKYARVRHPTVRGANDRTKIKQIYKPLPAPMAIPFFPPRWGINGAVPGSGLGRETVMKNDRRLTLATRSRLAARGWHVTSLYQPPWRFKPGPRRLARVPNEDDPWSATIHDGECSLHAAHIGTAEGATADEAVRAILDGHSDLRGALGRLEAEIEALAEALR